MTMGASVQKSVSLGGKTFNGSVSYTAQNSLAAEDSIPAAKTGTLTVRTDADTGSITGQSGHGIITGDKISIFWDTGFRYNVTVGTVSTNVIPIDLGDGDDLPIATTALTIMKGTDFELAFDGDSVEVVACWGELAGTLFEFMNGTTFVSVMGTPTANGVVVWTTDDQGTSGLEGATITRVRVTHGSSAAAKIARVGVLVA